MTRKILVNTVYRHIVWKETKKYLKHYRKIHWTDLRKYNKNACRLIELYRRIEYEIEQKELRITKFEYRDLIKDLEKGKKMSKIFLVFKTK